MLAFIGGLLGALLGGGLSYFVARYQSNSEHDKWLRQERLRIYSDFLASVSNVQSELVKSARYKKKLTDDQLQSLWREITHTTAQVLMIGPRYLATDAQAYAERLWNHIEHASTIANDQTLMDELDIIQTKSLCGCQRSLRLVEGTSASPHR